MNDRTLQAQLDVAGRAAVVFGGGGSALKHIAALTRHGALVTVVSQEVGASISDLAARGLVVWHRREFDEKDLDDTWLAVAATEDRDTDAAISRAAEAQRIWCLADPATQQSGPRSSSGGRVILVGGGPGDPGLLTAAGMEALRIADVVVTDRLAPLSLLAGLDPDVEVIDVGKVPCGKATKQSEINRMLIDAARAGKTVVRLKGGDSFLFGRGGEEIQACFAAGVEASVIPGVSSALAVPALAGIPVTHRGLVQGVTVVSGHVPPGHSACTIDYSALVRSGTTLVFLMAVATLPDITRSLLGHGLSAETPAATIANGTTSAQRVVRGTLADIADIVTTEGIVPPAVTVIGAVAALED
ncbi:uroporphyrinogen-III C-methyltransferase [Mycobacterium paragordonae]|jgi:uroporphyrin-III C-methyltransferase|uniref:uroporphyrinogen-III C-methyltransferase n=1 Tax=Mycobacterium paragordonae TaxID=1389713 RepID=UPI0012E0FCE2|nr:uroporphyrinogen-III C-methyltransferase [Mycobacterium paragordonae]